MALKSYTALVGGSNLEADLPTHLAHSTNLPQPNEYLVVYHIEDLGGFYALYLGGYTHATREFVEHAMTGNASLKSPPVVNTDYRFVQVGMNGFSPNSEFNFNTLGRYRELGKIGAVGYTLQFVEEYEREDTLSENPAIWETEPKEVKGLDVYYEASGSMPMMINSSNVQDAIPVGSTVAGYQVIGHNEDKLVFSNLNNNFTDLALDIVGVNVVALNKLEIIRPDGLKIMEKLDQTWWYDLDSTDTNRMNKIWATNEIKIESNLFSSIFTLNWHNCFSFGNGVESNRIRDNFNLPFITNGVKASTTLEQEYKEEHRKYGLIYSGLYNSISGVNNLNQFIQAEKITKDINPIYGSIQKLHSRDTDLVTLCEDKVLRILANKDAVFNADGNPNLTATENVLGQTIPFSGEYGISTNPESFASENYRVYFTDKIRGAVLRLSKDGLTPISEHGMKDWFRDNLKLSNKLIGSYDDKKEQYNITLKNILYTNKYSVVSEKGEYSNQYEIVLVSEPEVGAVQRISTNKILVPYGADIAIGCIVTGGFTTVSNHAIKITNIFDNGSFYEVTINQTPDWDIVAGLPQVMGFPYNIPWNTNVLNMNNLLAVDYNGDEDYFTRRSILTFTCSDSSFDKNAIYSSETTEPKTVSFKENVKGWVSFKSFFPDVALSMANDYYTLFRGELYKHHVEDVDRNTFYSDILDPDNGGHAFTPSSVDVILNDSVSAIKEFNTLNYEGSQSKVNKFTSTIVEIINQDTKEYNDQEYYNLYSKPGWNVESIITNDEDGYIDEFLEKEGKWFNNIKRKVDIELTSADTSDFSFQGIAQVNDVEFLPEAGGHYNCYTCVEEKLIMYYPEMSSIPVTCPRGWSDVPLECGQLDPGPK